MGRRPGRGFQHSGRGHIFTTSARRNVSGTALTGGGYTHYTITRGANVLQAARREHQKSLPAKIIRPEAAGEQLLERI